MKNRKMRGFGIFLAACLLFLCMPLSSVRAEASEIAIRGYSPDQARESRSQYQNAIDIKTLKNSTENFDADYWYKITDAEGLVVFAWLVNEEHNQPNLKGIKVCLANNIDMTGKSFTAIGNGITKYDGRGLPGIFFSGTFDGCGYQIDSLNMTVTETDSSDKMLFLSLFGILGSSATVKNLVIGEHCVFSCTVEGKYVCTAALAGRALEGATVENVLSLARVSGGDSSGGLIARIDPLTNRTANGHTVTVSGCSNAGVVEGVRYAGGLVGFCNGNVSVRNCRNTGNVSSSGQEVSSAGGILGAVEKAFDYEDGPEISSPKISVRLNNTANYGNIFSSGASGGLIGFADNALIDGADTVTLTLDDCMNEGSADQPFIGNRTTDRQIVLSSCTDRSAEVRLHGSQVRSAEGDTYSIRFIGSLGTLDYKEVGFYVTVTLSDGSTRSEPLRLSCAFVFRNLLADHGETDYTASELRGVENSYLYALTIEDIPADSGEVVFQVTPYGIRCGSGTEEEGETFVITYNNGEYVPAWRP